MPYSSKHKQRTRQKILQAAHRLFTSRGFEATSIEDVMLECGLTRGGFYAHFRSKGELYQQAVTSTEHAARHSFTGRGDAEDWLEAVFRLSAQGLGSGPQADSEWAFLATDVASRQPEVRAAYARAIRLLNERLRGDIGDDSSLAATALLVGSLAIAASCDDPPLNARIAEACRQATNALRHDETTAEPPAFFWAHDETSMHALH